MCYLQPEQVTLEIEKVIKDNFYPMEECLKIVTEYKIIEAFAKLCSYEIIPKLIFQSKKEKQIQFTTTKTDVENKRSKLP